MKERDTLILSIRIPKDLLPLINEKAGQSKRRSRNDWLLWTIKQGLREHKRNNGVLPGDRELY